MNFRAEVIIEVRFKTYSENGRRENIPAGLYGCPMRVGGASFDCRMFFDTNVELGKFREVGVQFLDPGVVLAKLSVGMPISLWEGRVIAEGRVKEILS